MSETIDVDIWGPTPDGNRWFVIRSGDQPVSVWGLLNDDSLPVRFGEVNAVELTKTAQYQNWPRRWSGPRDRALAVACRVYEHISNDEYITPLITDLNLYQGDWDLWPKDFRAALNNLIGVENEDGNQARLRAHMADVWGAITRGDWG